MPDGQTFELILIFKPLIIIFRYSVRSRTCIKHITCSLLRAVLFCLFFFPEDEATCSSQTFFDFQRTKRQYIPENIIFHGKYSLKLVVLICTELCFKKSFSVSSSIARNVWMIDECRNTKNLKKELS
jgi:hypothetical protein